MSKVTWKIVLYKKITSGWSSIGLTLTDYYDVQLNVSVGDGKDRFNFKIHDLDSVIDYEDQVVISRKTTSDVFTDDDILMVGVVRNVTPNNSGSSDYKQISGYNYSESIMSGLIFVDAINLTITDMFQEAINSLQLASDNFAVTWNPNNKTVTSTGDSFPLVGETLFNKSFRDILDKYSRTDKTGDGNYHWYVNKDNQLTWARNKGVSSGVFDEGTNRFNKLSAAKDTNDVRNFVVVKGGFDPKNRILQERYADYTSISKHGFKYYILIDENKTSASVLELDLNDAGVDDMRDASYPLTPRWSSSSVASFSAYANAFRTYLRSELKSIGKSFVDDRKNGKLKVTVNFKPKNHSYVVGNLVTCSFVDTTTPDGPMRVKEINYTTIQDAVVFEEDEGTL